MQQMKHGQQSKKSERAIQEEEVIAFWNNASIFEKTLKKDAPNGEFVFFDGPPFATGLPHIGHLLISSYKDAVGRYKTMRGYHVPRRWGWDCHGLPIENIVEKKLGLTCKKDIERLGIAKFNQEARKSVLTYVSDWKQYIERIGRWVDFDNSYKTMDNTYIESVWWGLKRIHEDGRLYEGRKVLMYCPRCETPLSKAEIAMDNSYRDVTDESAFVKFKIDGATIGLDGKVPTYILAWTTTPWTLPANVALAVGENIEYVAVRHDEEVIVVARDRVKDVLNTEEVPEEIMRIHGKDLVGISYEPVYEVEKVKEGQNAWHVVRADFVTTEDGTGVVHIAPMYGEDDFNLGKKEELPIVPLLDATGTFNADAPTLVRGMYFKKGGKYVLSDLKERGLLFATHPYTHSYPHCYRCDTPLIYNALTSWFIDIQSVKKRMLEANEDITWYPSHLKHGRFQHNIETAPDWTISRNRYWASPLPIWKNERTGKVHVFGSLTELREHTVRSGNTYLFVRHGEAHSNKKSFISTGVDDDNHLTEQGVAQARSVGDTLAQKGITKIIASPLARTKETAQHIAERIGYKGDITYDSRLQEWQVGDTLNGAPVSELERVCPTYESRFTHGCGGESLMEMKRRVGEALYEYEAMYKNEIILIVGHEYTGWLLECVARGYNMAQCIIERGDTPDYVKNGEVRHVDFVPIPHNDAYELDLHRPYIDEVAVRDGDGNLLTRIPEVVDCWVESGAMPFAAEHYPFEDKEVVHRRYPGDFIAEYIAQTRTWFYYMHALGVLLFNKPSFKTCVTTGTVLAEDGSKMSKSKKNYTDPLENINKYGADALRFYLLGSVVMAGEDLAFKDEEVREVHNRFINMLWNSYKFYALQCDVSNVDVGDTLPEESKLHILDVWILAKLDEVVRACTEHMDNYNTIRTARLLRCFVADYSQWYVRRSRDRFKSGDTQDVENALTVMRHTLLTFAKLVAPLTPFIAESLYRALKGGEESVHLDTWPSPRIDTSSDEATRLIEHMEMVRAIASLVLEVRQKEGIKVRQPLASVTLKNEALKGNDALLRVLLDEVNIKEVRFDVTQESEVVVDTALTDALVREGTIREVLRTVQAMRKKHNLTPQDAIILKVSCGGDGFEFVNDMREELARVAHVTKVVKGTAQDQAQSLTVHGDTCYFSIEHIA